MTLTAPGPGPHLPPRPPALRWRRRGQLGAVLLAVLAGHAWLIGPVRTPLGRAPEHTAAIQLVTLPPVEAPLPVEDRGAGPAAEPEQPPPPTPPVEETPAPPKHPDDRPIDWTAGPRPPEGVAGTEPPEPEPAASGAGTPAPGLVGDTPSDDGGPPPTYRTVPLAQAFKLDYRIERGDEAGAGQLSFEPAAADGRYMARLSGVIDNKALMDWVSRGSFDNAGMAPQRMVERQRGIEVRAVNFQRDKAVISFSSSTRALALFGGAQDRVSVLLQLVAIAEAQPGGLRPGQRIRLQVAGSRGQANDWIFEVLGEERIEPNGSPIDTVHLQRDPSQPYDQRVEVWLARAAGHVPAGLRFTTVPGKESTAFWLSSPLPVSPGPAASAARP